LARGVPEDAFEALTGDDPAVARRLKKRNRDEHSRSKAQGVQMGLGEAPPAIRVDTSSIAHKSADIDQLGDGDFAAVTTKQRRYLEFIDSPELRNARFLADAWCAAFVWSKTEATETIAPTQALLQILCRDPSSTPPGLREAVARLAAGYQFFHWHLAFPHVFSTGRKGFAAVLGNPPWEHVEIKEEEFFAARAPTIATARNASERKKAISKLQATHPALYEEFQGAVRLAEGETHIIRASGKFPLCARGRINTFAIFAELNRDIIGRPGRSGCILPSGIAVDDTTKFFFRDIVRKNALKSFYSFWEIRRFFHDTESRQPFALMTIAEDSSTPATAALAFDLRSVAGIQDRDKIFRLSAEDFELLNPNSGTCPIFASGRDAEVTKSIYRRIPILVREGAPPINPWGISFRQGTFNMASDSAFFRTGDQFDPKWSKIGTTFIRGEQQYIPLYEAKMIHHFDHRFGTYEGQTESNAAQGKLPETTTERHSEPAEMALPRYWVNNTDANERLEGRWRHGWLLGWRDICRSSDNRTVIAAVLPRHAAGHTIPLAFTSEAYHQRMMLLCANLSSMALDYVARQKVGGTHLTFGLLNQLPIVAPTAYSAPCSWSPGHTLADWLHPRVLELTYTAWDLTSFARDHGWVGPPFRWDEQRRFLLRVELDAAFFHIYGIAATDDVTYILDTFPLVRQRDQKEHGTYRTKDLILALHEGMRQAMQGGPPYVTPLDPPPADPSLTHPPLAPDDPLWSVIPRTRPPTSDTSGVPVPSTHPGPRTRTAAPADPAQPGVGTTAALFLDEPTPPAPRPSARARTKPARTAPPTDASPPTFELAPPPAPQPHLFAAVPSTPAKPKSASAASFHLHSPDAPNQHLFATQPTPSEPPPPAPAYRLSPPPGDASITHDTHAVPGGDKVLPFRFAVRPQQSAAVAPAAPHHDLPAWSPDLLSAVATTTGLPASAGRWGTTRTGVNLGIAALAAVLRNMSGPASSDEVERAVVLSILPALLQSKFDTKTALKWRRAIGKANMSLTSIAALSISWAEVLHRATVERLLEIDADGHWLAGADINDVPTGELDARALVALSWLASVSGASVEDAELVTQLGVLRVA
jgi:hypothetical protein